MRRVLGVVVLGLLVAAPSCVGYQPPYNELQPGEGPSFVQALNVCRDGMVFVQGMESDLTPGRSGNRVTFFRGQFGALLVNKKTTYVRVTPAQAQAFIPGFTTTRRFVDMIGMTVRWHDNVQLAVGESITGQAYNLQGLSVPLTVILRPPDSYPPGSLYTWDLLTSHFPSAEAGNSAAIKVRDCRLFP